MFQRLHVLLVLLLVIGANAQQKSAETESNLPSEQTVNEFMRATFGFDSSLSWKVLSIRPSETGLAEVNVIVTGPQGAQDQKFYVTPDGKHVVIGEVMPFGSHPFADTQKVLAKGMNGPSRGPATAPVTLVEFSDLQCPHCKEAQPNVDKLISEHKNVRLVFQSFPLPMHDWASKAAKYADCVSHASNDGFWKFISGVYGAQSDITASNADEKLTEIATSSGVKGPDIAVCAAKPETATNVERSKALGKELAVDSTPTFFMNGRKLPAVPYDVLERLVDFSAKEGQ